MTKFALVAVVATLTLAPPVLAQGELAPAMPEICTSGMAHDMGSMAMDLTGMDQAHQDLAKGMDETNAQMMQGVMVGDIDVAFICAMIPHHQAAINMANAELAHGDDPWAREMARKIIDAQTSEIAQMRDWLAKQANTDTGVAPAAYALELVGEPVRSGGLVTFSVELKNTATNEVVPDAALNVDDFNMEPDGMTGSSTVHPKSSDRPGVFTFEVEPTMGGRWGLVYTATIPDQPKPIKGTLVITIPE